ncbi:M48 family metallopeptidase [Flavivirga spongiicola]|uniref:M48 family metallopeptidase n=1 Tax=Flavivirga spongiicola TaxID=421621 RepID=A0ABU7XQH8_9FLAO|nr:M48 family metallopeptidase [Flavivirga sp. MEBiC05379]MDO5978035.1 M48 family metallopeptidase [Flavivirga sp. MEBiC05379]
MEIITTEKFEKATYPNESNRFNLAMLTGIPIAILGLILTIASFGLILIYIGVIVFFVWFSLSIAKMNLVGNSVKVSSHNFPEIFNIYTEVKKELSYTKEVQIYIVEDGSVNAFLAKFFKTQFIVLNSELVKDMLSNKDKLIQMKWIIARFVGALKAKHFKTTILKLIFENLERIKIFNFFLLPYERATQYTGDNIGMMVTQNVEQSIVAFNKLMVGNDLSLKIEFRGILDQGKMLRNDSFFSFLARAFSSHPHLINRYLNLLAYASKEFPEQFDKYISDLDNETKHNLFRMLPYY